jgi:hypothetical protein
MAARRSIRGREAQLGFDALAIIGGLLSPEWLAKVTQLAAGQQAEADYDIPKGLNLRDELGRYWRIAQAAWKDFAAGRAAGADARALSQRFVVALLRDVFGFATLVATPPVVVDERAFPIGHAALGGRVPVVIAPAGAGVESHDLAFGDDGRRRTAFGLAQEYLNAQEGALWGLVSDGVTLRVVRDNASLTRPAWLHADLERIFTEERYADFTALWLLIHQSRFGRAGQAPTACALETWREAGREQGTRAREHLRRGVEDALLALGQGFLAHPANVALRADLQRGTVTKEQYYAQLLRLIYRLIFLLTAEERTAATGRPLLHTEDARADAIALYAEGYGLRQLRERAVRRSARDHHGDLWAATQVVFRGLATGEPRLALPALAGLFAADQCPTLDACELANHALLEAVFGWPGSRTGPRAPSSASTGATWAPRSWARSTRACSSWCRRSPRARAASASPAVPRARATPARAPAATTPPTAWCRCSSTAPSNRSSPMPSRAPRPPGRGPARPHHRRSGLRLGPLPPRRSAPPGRSRRADRRRGTPSDAEYRHALRQVVGRCIFGVDVNPLAVELCRVGLWMEALEPGLPLTFLDSHIQHGNALLGTTPELMKAGIPDAAWEALSGDDKKVASALKKRNKAERTGTNEVFEFSRTLEGGTLALRTQVQVLDAAPDASVGDVARKASTWAGILASQQYRAHTLAADAWCAAFVWPKRDLADPANAEFAAAAPTHLTWERLRHEPELAAPLLVEQVDALAASYRFFHWHLRFPQVFARGGFDVVLGNPPWERVKLQEQEFFASRDGDIASAPNAAARKKLIAALPTTNRRLWDEWMDASRKAEGESHLIRSSGRYPLCGKGDVNTYAIFAEHNRAVLGPRGRAGFIVPTGIATDDGTSAYFSDLVGRSALVRFESFENFGVTFAGVNNRQSFSFLVVSALPVARATLRFNVNQDDRTSAEDKEFQLSAEDFHVLNPNTGTCPTFRSKRDAAINLAMYRRTGILWREDDPDGNPWGLRFLRMLDMANDSGSFRTRADLEAAGWSRAGNRYERERAQMLPLIEAKMVHHFDHRYASLITSVPDRVGRISRKFEGWYSARVEDPKDLVEPQYWVAEEEVSTRLAGRWQREWLLGWRDICRSTDRRTLVASVIPAVAVGHKLPLMLSAAEPVLLAALYANLCSFALDYATRQKVGGTSLTYFIVKQLPVLPPSSYVQAASWQRGTPVRDWLLPRVLELTYTAWDLAPFARDVGHDGPPFLWDAARRFQLRCELDAAFFHLYGVSRSDTDHILDGFKVVRDNDVKAHGEYRTKRAILEIYDALATATATGVPYQSPLGPPRTAA